jgi:hypothetical protein
MGGSAEGSRQKAYIHFDLEVLPKGARLRKRVIGRGGSEAWKNGSRSKKRSEEEKW